MIQNLLGFVMVLTRISAFLLIVPIFSQKVIPVMVKIALTFLLSIFFFLIKPSAVNGGEVCIIEAILLIFNEAIYGFALGLTAALVFYSIKLSGRIIERQMGMAMAQILDPLSGEGAQSLGIILELIFVLLLLSANGHHMFLLIISGSYDSFPSGSIPTIAVLTSGIVKSSSTMLIAGLRLAAPMLAAFLVLMATLAVLARIAPEMNILFISFPIRIGLGLLMVGAFLPFIDGFVSEFAGWMGKLLPL